MRVLGVEGTAWAASAAIYDDDADRVTQFSEAYQPDSGGLHPREAAEHMREHIPAVIEAAIAAAEGPIDAVAFSRGPGLGPCLRVAASAARSAALTLDVPLAGVNHMVAHLEVGRQGADFARPVCLNASGANAHVLALHNGRYRVLGETVDTGVGNAIDKFARHLGWGHPGGPKVEARAADGEWLDLPYVVKGMDFSFAGITSAAQDAVEDGAPVADVCFSLQETVFAMLTEVAERALALTGSDELVLGGGVGQNERLQAMLTEMCAARGAQFHAPDPEYLRDNGGMIAMLGARMVAAGSTLSVEESAVRPDFRPDQVPVTWRTADERGPVATGTHRQGAEAAVTLDGETVTKRRASKTYRHPALDERLRQRRTVNEARLTAAARREGVPTPVVFDVDRQRHQLILEEVGDADLQDALTLPRVRAAADSLATLHDAGYVHGDPTTRNVRVDTASHDRVILIDFGLGYHSRDVEDFAVDLHVFNQSLAGTASDPTAALEAAREAYADAGDAVVLDRLDTVAGRGRYQ
ncbi:MAG: bifunctional N(6)-L-threonylcarbamoyladenine synthase/serine/threonine protein kinase [Halobacteriaceae archaeon]